MKNYVMDGEVVTMEAPYDLANGEAVQVGSVFGVSAKEAKLGEAVDLSTVGVFDLVAESTQSYLPGTELFWDAAKKRITSVSGVGSCVGVCMAPKAAGTAVVRTKLAPVFRGLTSDPASLVAVRGADDATFTYSWYDTGGTGGPIQVYENDRSLYTHTTVGDVNRIICVDPINGNDAGDGTPANPKKTLKHSAAGGAWTGAVTNYQLADMICLKRATRLVHDTGDAIRLGGNNRHMGAYGDPSLPRPVVQSSQSSVAGPYTVLIESENCSFADIDVDASLSGGDKSGVVITNGSREQDIYSVVVQNSTITGVTSTISGTYPNIASTLRAPVRVMANGQSGSRTTAYNTAYDIDIINVDAINGAVGGFHTSGCAGKWINGVLHGVRLRGCKTLGGGWRADGLGMSSFSMGTLRDVFPTFTLASGTTYWFDVSVASIYNKSVPDIEILHMRIGSIWNMRRTTNAQTAPAVGEFGFDVTTQRVYVNGGAALPTTAQTTNGVDMCTYATKGMLYDRCFVRDMVWAQTTSTHEAHGIAFDDFTSDSIVMNCELINNAGMGVSLNRGLRNQVLNSRFAGNGFGAVGGLTLGSRVWGNWVESSTRSQLSGRNGVIAVLSPVYKFSDLQNRVGGFRRLAYTGSDPTGALVDGVDNFDCPSLLFDDSVVVPGVGSVTSGLVLARGMMTPAEAARRMWSPNFVGL
jgi:predicted RecA/RadA family phage recombinase